MTQLCLQRRPDPGQPVTSCACRFRRRLGSLLLSVSTCFVGTAVSLMDSLPGHKLPGAGKGGWRGPEGSWPGGRVGPGHIASLPRKRKATGGALKSSLRLGALASWAGVPWSHGHLLRMGTICQRQVGHSPGPLPRGPWQARKLKPEGVRVVEAGGSLSLEAMVQGRAGLGGLEGGQWDEVFGLEGPPGRGLANGHSCFARVETGPGRRDGNLPTCRCSGPGQGLGINQRACVRELCTPACARRPLRCAHVCVRARAGAAGRGAPRGPSCGPTCPPPPSEARAGPAPRPRDSRASPPLPRCSGPCRGDSPAPGAGGPGTPFWYLPLPAV